MKNGKVAENVLKRSILKKTGAKRADVIGALSIGADYAVLDTTDSEELLVGTASVTDSFQRVGIIKATNNLAAGGAEPIGVSVNMMLPCNTTEEQIKAINQEIDACCKELKISVTGGHSEISEAVTRPVISYTAFGKRNKSVKADLKGANIYDDIVVTKWIGIEGTVKIAYEREKELLEKFPSKMIYDAKNLCQFLSVVPEAAPAIKSGATAMHDVSGGGIFAALWELAQAYGVGLEVELRKIPVKQETIEICNYYDINPYELSSAGSMLMTAPDGNRLVMELRKAGIEASVIGKITSSNDRVVLNGDIRRFLEPVKNDDINKVFA